MCSDVGLVDGGVGIRHPGRKAKGVRADCGVSRLTLKSLVYISVLLIPAQLLDQGPSAPVDLKPFHERQYLGTLGNEYRKVKYPDDK